MPLTHKHLEQIEAIAELKSFAKAGKKLNISQPALSRSIASLENQLGVRLFDRKHNNVTPTFHGRYIVEKGRSLLQGLKLLKRDLQLLRDNQAGEIHIGCGPIAAELFIGKALARFHERYPLLNLHISVDKTPHLLKSLRERTLDLFVADARMIRREQDLEITDLDQRQAYFCCHKDHPLTRLEGIRIKDILTFPLAVMWIPGSVIDMLSRETGTDLDDVTDLPNGVIKCDNFSILHTIVHSTNAVGISIEELIRHSPYREHLSLLTQVRSQDFMTSYAIVTLKGYAQPPAIEFLEQCIFDSVVPGEVIENSYVQRDNHF